MARIPDSRGSHRVSITAASLAGVLAAAFVFFPLTAGVAVIRVAPFLLAAGSIVLLAARPWRWSPVEWSRVAEWNPSTRQITIAAIVCSLTLLWFVVTRFQSGDINAIDFTVYYDRPILQTLHGRPLYIESTDDPARAYRSYFAVHAHWIMVPLALLYALWATPLWMLALSVGAVVGGAIYVLHIVRFAGGGGLLGSAAALAFFLNDNTARTLNYGFHVEVLYAWLIPWMLYSALTRKWLQFAAASAACIAVKEDAVMFVAAVAATVALLTHGRMKPMEWLCLAAPIVIAGLNLVLYYALIVPALGATATPFYAPYWANYGPTSGTAVIGMLSNPGRVVMSTLRSGLVGNVMPPHLFLPLVGWRWFVAIVPVILLYGASANAQLRAFGIYYAIPLVPFLVLGAAFGAHRCADLPVWDKARRNVFAAVLILVGALLGGVSDAGYSLRPWRSEIRAVRDVIRTANRDQGLLVQSALYPHAGYESHVQLLTRDTLEDRRYKNALLVLAPRLDTYPLTPGEIASLAESPRSRTLLP
jgi:uncharacterized membrane protein